jgi:cytochrome P450
MSHACSQGVRLPTHTKLILNIFTIHRVPNVWENPDAFKPSRFLEHCALCVIILKKINYNLYFLWPPSQ